MEKHNLLIVGGSGSIGSALIKSLDYDQIYVLDKQISKNIGKHIKYFTCDLLDLDSINNVISKLPSNLLVIYLAGNLTMEFNSTQIRESLNDNVIALTNFLNSLKSKLIHFIFVSSISVYGIPLYNPINESHPIQPLSLYGCAKASAEMMCKALCKNYMIPLTTLRLTQLYDLPSAYETFPHILLNAIKSRNFSRIKVNPYVERDYLHLSDFIDFLKILIKHPKQGVFNIGFGEGVNLINLTKSMSSFYNINLDDELIFDENPSYSQIMDISSAKELFNYEPKQRIDSWLKNELKS